MSTSTTSAVIVSLVSILAFSSSQPAVQPTSPTHDMSCVVPPVPVNNITGNQLVTLTVASPWFPDPAVDRIRDTIFYTFGNCGLDVFVLEKGWIFESLIPVGFNNFCRKSDPRSQSDMPQVSILSAGSSAGGIAPTLMPLPRRLPTNWRSGIVIWIRYNRLVAEEKPFHITCNYPYTNILGGINVVLNVNATLTIEGCPFRKYGTLCDQACDYCAEGINCNSFTGACICPKGFIGTTCAEAKQNIRVNTNELYIPYGESANLTCSSHGFTPVTHRWHKNSIPQRSITYIQDVNYTPRPLVMYTVIVASDTSVDGVYVCEITDTKGKLYVERVSVTVIGITDAFVEFPLSQEVTVGSEVSFRCSVKELTGILKWYKGPFSFPQNSTTLKTGGRLHVIPRSLLTSELFIRDVRVEDDDVYRCFVGHVFTERDIVYAQARLTVFVPTKSRIVGYTESEVLVHPEKVPLQLVCRADRTKPAPRVAWFIGDKVWTKGVFTDTVLSEDGITFNITSTLNISPIWRHNAQAVRCVMENMAVGVVSQTSVVLNITFFPKVKTPKEVSVLEGEELVIECLAQANPEATKNEWTVTDAHQPGSHALSPSSFRNVTDDVPFRNTGQFNGDVYIIKKVDPSHNNLLVKCTVYNALGKGFSETYVRVSNKAGLMSTPVVGIAIVGAVVLLVIAVFIHCCRRQIRSFCASRFYKEDTQGDRDYDVFICYKSGTEEEELYVVRILIPWLEERGFSVCVHYKDFTRDKDEHENIIKATIQSSKIILVLSPAFINSAWYQYDFRPSLEELHLRQHDVIPIMYEDMTLASNIDPVLYRLLRNVSYIHWPAQDPEGSESRELFWKILRKSLPRVPLGSKGGGIASSEVSLPDIIGTVNGMGYNVDDEKLWPLPPKRERLFKSRRQSNTSQRRELITPAARRQREFDRQELRRQQEMSEMHDGIGDYRLHDPRRVRNMQFDTYDPNSVLII